MGKPLWQRSVTYFVLVMIFFIDFITKDVSYRKRKENNNNRIVIIYLINKSKIRLSRITNDRDMVTFVNLM